MEAQSIVEGLAAVIERPITLEDTSGHLIAYSVHDVPVDTVRVETLLRKGVSLSTREALTSRGVYKLIDGTGGITLVPGIPEIGFEPRVAMAIRRGSDVFGYLWVAYGSVPVPAEVEQAILESARLLSRELGRTSQEDETRPGERSGLVKDLVNGALSDDSAIRSRAREAGWQIVPSFQVLVVREAPGSGRSVSWCSRELQAAIGDDFGHPLAGFVDNDGVIVLSGSSHSLRKEMASRVNARLSRDGVPLATVGIGSTCESVGDIQQVYGEAIKAMSLGTKVSPNAAFLEYEALAPYDLLSCMAGCSMCGSYGREQIEKIISYDSMHGQNLMETLEAYLDWYGSRKRAASRLKVHPNTLDYRVRKIAELIDMDLDDPSVRLALHIWIKALSIFRQ